MKSFARATALVLALAAGFTPQRAQAVEVVYGIVATVAIYGLGYSGYGTGLFILLSSGKNVRMKSDDFRQAIDVVATEDASLITPALARSITEIRDNEPALAGKDDLVVLASLVDGINKNL